MDRRNPVERYLVWLVSEIQSSVLPAVIAVTLSALITGSLRLLVQS